MKIKIKNKEIEEIKNQKSNSLTDNNDVQIPNMGQKSPRFNAQ